jgi:cell division septum initiation protein DivIVA
MKKFAILLLAAAFIGGAATANASGDKHGKCAPHAEKKAEKAEKKAEKAEKKAEKAEKKADKKHHECKPH